MTPAGPDGVFALGDAAAVPDLAKDGRRGLPAHRAARHAAGQGRPPTTSSRRCGASRCSPYLHKDLGLVVDLGGTDAVSKPLGIELRGLPAQAVARGYHWAALRTNVAKTRVMTNWLLNAVAGDDFVRTGFQARKPATLRDFEYTDAYLTETQIRSRVSGGSPVQG